MAIYRPPKARWPVALGAGVAGAVAGLLVGFGLGTSDATPEEAAAAITTRLTSAASSLEVAAIEYEESVANGRVVKETEFEGALSALRSSRSKYEQVRSALEAIAPERVRSIDQLYEEVSAAMEARADASEVGRTLDALGGALEGDAQGT